MKTQHKIFLIVCGSWITLATSYGVNTRPDLGFYQLLGQVIASLLPITVVYYVGFYLVDYLKKKLKK